MEQFRGAFGQFWVPWGAFGRLRAVSGFANNCLKVFESARKHPKLLRAALGSVETARRSTRR
eukprot:13253490-Alexandrium_andersonii.AAC.1